MVELEVDKNRLVLTNHRTRARLEAMGPLHLRGYSEHEAFLVSVAGSPGDNLGIYSEIWRACSLVHAVFMYTQAQETRIR